MQRILDGMGLDYHAADGEAAFYGPKLDIQIRNVFGKEDTLITIQIDFQLAQRFGMEYTDRDGSRKHPTIIHRTSIGCYERTLALVLEKFGGAMPLWIAPEQARILPIAERHLEAAEQLRARMAAQGLRVTVDTRDEKIGKKIREAQVDKIPYMLVLGDKEIESGAVALRARAAGDQGAVPADEVIGRLVRETAERVIG
jgi:threonyl-tRNA synthetase